MDKQTIIEKNILDAIALKRKVLEDNQLMRKVDEVSDLIIRCYQNGNKVLFCGNGGSAADAQHLAAELSGRYYYDRPPLAAEALHTNTSYLTAVANDYSYDVVYARLIKAVGQKEDILIGLSTSGNSKNVIQAFIQAKQNGMRTIGLTGQGGGAMKAHTDILIDIPSSNTPRIQELHMIIGHSICQKVEQCLFPQKDIS